MMSPRVVRRRAVGRVRSLLRMERQVFTKIAYPPEIILLVLG
jgi:hypothetical protein